MSAIQIQDYKATRLAELHAVLHKAVSKAIFEMSDEQLTNLVKEPYDSFAAEHQVAQAA